MVRDTPTRPDNFEGWKEGIGFTSIPTAKVILRRHTKPQNPEEIPFSSRVTLNLSVAEVP